MKNPDVMSGFFRFVHSAFLRTLVDGIFAPQKKIKKIFFFFFFLWKMITFAKYCQLIR